jgi:ribosomal RNA assembly protein
MKKIISEKSGRIIKSREEIEKVTKVEVRNRGKEIYLQGKPEDEFVAEKVIDALDFGFPFGVATLIKKEDFEFEVIDIKKYTSRKDLEVIRGRIIGKGGKTLKTLSDLSNCFFEINGNHVGIIGPIDYIKFARESIISLIRGSKQSNVYHSLEKSKVESLEDLGLKESFEKKLKDKRIEE